MSLEHYCSSDLSRYISRDFHLDVRNAFNTNLSRMKTVISDLAWFCKRDLEVYSGGSSTEGTETSQSDTDAMMAIPYMGVFTTDTIPNVDLNLFRANTTGSKPGYIRLVPVNFESMRDGQFGKLDDIVEETSEGMFLSSEKLVRVNSLLLEPGRPSSLADFYRHGPCLTTEFQSIYGFRTEPAALTLGIDVCLALECDQWLGESKEWLTRKRNHDWPDPQLVEKISRRECFAVPIGDPTSANFSREWRVSFLLGERDMIWNFNDTQIQCYVILKMLRQNFIEPILPEQISSYHLKTIIFWKTEDHGLSEWTESNLMNCVKNCLSYLISCIQTGELQHYFYRKNNLFRNKLLDQAERDTCVEVIDKIINDPSYVLQGGLLETSQVAEDWQVCNEDISRLEEMCNARHELSDRFERNKRVNEQIRFASSVLLLCNYLAASMNSLHCLLSLQQELEESLPADFDQSYVKLVKSFIDIRLGIVSFCFLEFAEIETEFALWVLRSKLSLDAGQAFEQLTSSLYLATYHLACGNNIKCKEVVLDELSKQQVIVYTGRCSKNPGIITGIEDELVTQTSYLPVTGKAGEPIITTFDVIISKHDSAFVPEPLKYECAMFSNYGDGSFLIHPCVYANLLLFLSCFKADDLVAAREHLRRLDNAVAEIGYTPLRYQALNLLGYCYAMNGQFDEALTRYVYSLMDTYARTAVRNAAGYLMGILLCRVMGSDKDSRNGAWVETIYSRGRIITQRLSQWRENVYSSI